MISKNRVFRIAAIVTILGMQSLGAVPTMAATSNVTPGNTVLVNKVINGESIYWTQADQDAANKRQAEFNSAIINQPQTSGTNSVGITPYSVIGAPPFAAQSLIGTALNSNSDNLQDSSESTASGAKDSYLILENASANTCGPIAAHNLLTHFGPALNFTQLEPKVGYVNGSTGWSSQYATGLNSQESSYTYTAFGYVSTLQSAWDNTYIDLACAVGLSGVPTAMNPNGQLPGFTHSVGHWVVGYGYSGWYNDTNEANKTMKYFDSSQEHSGTYWFVEPESLFIGNITINGIVG